MNKLKPIKVTINLWIDQKCYVVTNHLSAIKLISH